LLRAISHGFIGAWRGRPRAGRSARASGPCHRCWA
jgi:hypothetical protein